MKITVQVVVEGGDADPTVVREVFALERGALSPDTAGLALDEAKSVLAALQETVVTEQVREAVAEQGSCRECGKALRHKDARVIVLRTLFGTLQLDSPRWHQCVCRPQTTRTFSPLATLLPERTTPELVYLESKFAGLVSYGLSAEMLGEVLPLGRLLHGTTVRRHAQAVASRLEDELGPEQWSFIEGCQAAWEKLPRPDLPLTVSLDGGFVHSAAQTSRRDGWFEVIAGTSTPAEGPGKAFGFVQTYDTKPRRRLFEVLRSQGMRENQQVTFVTDGADDVRDLPLYLNPQAEHVLDWFHVTMRLTVMAQMAKGLPAPKKTDSILPDPSTVAAEVERLKWFLWHGNVFMALQVIDGLDFDLEPARASPEHGKLLKAVREFGGYIRANAASIPNYGELYRAGETISSAMAEATVNRIVSKRMVKKQQMRWTPRGAHLLLQVRTRVLNDELAADFRRWYPRFTHTSESVTMAA